MTKENPSFLLFTFFLSISASIYASSDFKIPNGQLFNTLSDMTYYQSFDAVLEGDELYVLYSSREIGEDNFIGSYKRDSYGVWNLEKTFLTGELAFPHTINLYPNNSLLISDSDNSRVLIVSQSDGQILWDSEQLGIKIDYPNDAEYRSEESGKIFVSGSRNGIYEIKVDEGIVTNHWKIEPENNIHDLDIIDGGNFRYVDSDTNTIYEINRKGEKINEYPLELALDWPRSVEQIKIKGRVFEFAGDMSKIVRIKPDGEEVIYYDRGGYNFHFTKEGLLVNCFSEVVLIDYYTKNVLWSVSFAKENGGFTSSMENYEAMRAVGYVQ